jgi:predicted CXXCH cytochrome family protein
MFPVAAKKLCFTCHSAMKTKIYDSRFQHEPVAAGRCTDCHAPHGASFPPLLKAFYSRDFYAAYSPEHYALCFSCHNEHLADYNRTSEATGFRDDDRNLHRVHVNKPHKGRTCGTCHDVHGANQPRLILNSVPGFGKWLIPLNFSIDDFGGTCVVGCHTPKNYRRM